VASSPQKPKLLVVVGETASGKSDLALKLAKKLDGEIISADSWQVYKGFDVGTAKPSTSEQKQVKHHLIDVREADEGFNAPLFKKMAQKAIKDISSRGKLPIIVGGTGLYIDSLIYDYGFLPAVPATQRAKLNSMSLEDLIKEGRVRKINLETIDLRNKRRVIRAIEAKGQKPTKKTLMPGIIVIGLRLSREELRNRLDKRVEKMFKEGLEQEVKGLSEQHGWGVEPMKGIGYREFKDYFAGDQTLDQTKKRIISSTLNLAKRQRTWFKRHNFIHWYDSPEAAFTSVIKSLNN
jgi:tRNA dimethylallyltransferase